jgi:hypothetical protein
METESLDSLFTALVDTVMVIISMKRASCTVTVIRKKAQVDLFIGNDVFCPFFLGAHPRRC